MRGPRIVHTCECIDERVCEVGKKHASTFGKLKIGAWFTFVGEEKMFKKLSLSRYSDMGVRLGSVIGSVKSKTTLSPYETYDDNCLDDDENCFDDDDNNDDE